MFAVLNYLSTTKHCRMLFSTHYNFIIQSFLHHPTISTGYMSYLLDSNTESVTFLYKLVEGVCPDSFGINVARLAGIPEPLLQATYRQTGASRTEEEPRRKKCDEERRRGRRSGWRRGITRRRSGARL